MAGVTAMLTKQEVDRLDHEWAAAYTRGDMATVASLYTVDAVVMPPGGEAIHGRQAIEQFWRAAQEQMGIKSATLTPLEVVASGDIAYEVGAATLNIEGPSGQATSTAKYLVVWRQQPDGAWRLAADIWNSNTSA